MTTGAQRQARVAAALVAIDTDFPLHRTEAAIRSSLDAGCLVMVMAAEESPVRSEFLDIPKVHRHLPIARMRRGDQVRAMAAAADRLGMTHLITLDPRTCGEQAITEIMNRIRTHPEAVVCATRAPAGARLRYGWRRCLASFWFRVQTGLRITDSTGGLRAYPLEVIQGLHPLCGGLAFDYEMLVRAAWAGVAIEEVPITAVALRPVPAGTFTQRMALMMLFLGLQIHLTMRSVLPWPHRRVPGRHASPPAISIFHPRRSLRILLGQNISAARLGCSVGLGVFLGTLPLIACHSIATLFAAGFFRLNKVAALAAGQLCMPPIVPALCIELGYYVRHGMFLTEISLRTLGYEAVDRLVEWGIGSLMLAPPLAAAAGTVVYVMAHQIGRRSASGRHSPEEPETD
jgi:hypothetical protein